MVRLRRALCCSLLWLPLSAHTAELEILPKYCLIVNDAMCRTNITVRWQADAPACLVNATSQRVLHCAKQQDNFVVTVHSKQTVAFNLVDQASNEILLTTEFKILHNQPQALQQRRLSWSIF
ncbi:DUF3019 domain-containing protein [Rheinheimera maricola]|uniref:DUF3019 domain-containing protein n=1 Tax=Rheinheimera maricola TaxID=2793282 RepID=A0ABS7X7D0_9GAMM|nr:DUF3019 domain-containing protein [Rheinheimera maricola]MBZ9611455.1 DUF3019 domain-containing protein [Rheinheimera maricola]